MTGTVRASGLVLTGDQPMDSGLSPAEARRIVRQRLERLAADWGLQAADPHRLARQMRARTYAPGEVILPQGARGDCMGLVARGQVAVYVGKGEAARMTVVLMPGSTFGETMLSEGRPSHATLRALTPCTVDFVLRADLQALSQERRSERQLAALWRLVATSAVLLLLALAVALTLSLPQARRVVSLVPMAAGQWCSQQGHDTCTEAMWWIAGSLVPDDPTPLLAVGALRFEEGDIAAAEQAFEEAKALAADSPEVANNLGLIYAWQGEQERAIAAFEQALTLEPGIAATEHNLALSLQATGAYEEAIVHYQTALALGGPQTSTLASLAIAYYETGQAEEAADAARQALRYDGSLAPAHTVLGAVALELRQPAEAVSHLERAVAGDNTYGSAYFFLGLAHKSLGQPNQAIAAFERALILAEDETTRVRIRRHLNELYGSDEQNRAYSYGVGRLLGYVGKGGEDHRTATAFAPEGVRRVMIPILPGCDAGRQTNKEVL